MLQILKSAEEGVEMVVCSESMSGEEKTSWDSICKSESVLRDHHLLCYVWTPMRFTHDSLIGISMVIERGDDLEVVLTTTAIPEADRIGFAISRGRIIFFQ